AEAGRGEAPRQLRGLRDADARADEQLGLGPVGRAGLDRDRPLEEARAVEVEVDRERLGELPGPRAEVVAALEAAPRAHRVEPLERLERPDQHRRADTLGLTYGVE